MIVAAISEDDRWSIVTQIDHARLSAQLLGLWRERVLVGHPRRERLLLAVREHDNGWREADAAPLLHPDGDRPHDFMTIPETTRLEIWRRGTSRFLDHDPYVALLLIEHALRLLEGGGGEPRRQLLLWLREERSRLLAEAAAVEETALSDDYRWLELADLLSLVACNRWQRPTSRHGQSARFEAGTLYLAPFPFAGTTRLLLPCRSLERRPYRDAVELATALASCRWDDVPIRLAPENS